MGLIPENELSEGAGVQISPATSGAVVSDTFETSVPGVFACGNVLHVHDLVDHVSNESFLAGHAAARFVRDASGAARDAAFIPVLDGEGVRGTVPQKIRPNPSEPVTLMFRPAAVYRGAAVSVRCGERELMRKKALIFTPGEMVAMDLKPEALKGLDAAQPITVEIGKA